MGHPAIAEASDPGVARRRQLHPARRHARDRGALSLPRAPSVRDPALNAGQTGASRAINEENGWRAQRYGIHGSFVDEVTRSAKPVRQMLDETLELVAEDAKALGCERELDLCRWIMARGTSADRSFRSTRRRSAAVCRAGTRWPAWWIGCRRRRWARDRSDTEFVARPHCGLAWAPLSTPDRFKRGSARAFS